jgi:hypothetical protein
VNTFTGTINLKPLSINERRLRVFENRVLRRIFGPNIEEETGDRRVEKTKQ